MTDSNQPPFANGVYYKEQSVRDFVMRKLSIRTETFIKFLEANTGEEGFCNILIKEKRSGDGFYAVLDTWKPEGGQRGKQPAPAQKSKPAPAPEVNNDDMPPEEHDDVPF